MADSVVRLVFLGESSQAIRSVSRLEGAFGGLGKATKLATGALAIGLVGGLALATKKALDFQRSMELIHTQAGASQAEVQKMSKALLGMAKAVGTTPTDLAKGLFHIESAGLRGAKALSVLRAAAMGAKVGQADLESVTNALIAAQKSGIKGAGSMTHAMGVLNATVGAGNMRMNDLTAALATGLIPKAAAVGLSLQDVGAALGTLTTHGMHAEDAATRLAMGFFQMAATTPKADKALKSIGITNNQLATDMRRPQGLLVALTDLRDRLKNSGKTANEQTQIIADVFGRRSVGAILDLIQHVGDYGARLKHINATTKDFGEAWKSTTHTVSFELDKAKASLEAAAIPVGNVLLPVLTQAAGKVGEFATAIQSHMPQIRQQLQGVVGVVETLGGLLQRLALSPVGIAGIAGGLAAFGAAKLIGGIAGLAVKAGEASVMMTRLGIAGMALRGPLGLALAAATGLGVGFFILRSQTDDASSALGKLNANLRDLRDASQAAGQAQRSLSNAKIQVLTTGDALAAEEKRYAQVVRQSGKNSNAARVELHQLMAARQAHTDALANERIATENVGKANTAAIAQLGHLRDLSRGLKNMLDLGNQSTSDYAKAMLRLGNQAVNVAKTTPGLSASVRASEMQFGRTAQTVALLTWKLGRVPTKKEIAVALPGIRQRLSELDALKHRLDTMVRNVVVNVTTAFSQVGSPSPRTIHRAAGGFVPGGVGAPVPVIAHAGEIILNPAQQSVLGGPRFLSQLFGFHGEQGPGFAAGGVVTKRPRPVSHHHPHRTHSHSVKGTSAAVSAILKRLSGLDEDKQFLDQEYGNLDSRFRLADADQSFVNDDGTVNHPFVQQRVGELHTLIGKREELMAKIGEQEGELVRGIALLKAAIKRLMRQLAAEQKRIARDTAEISRLSAQIYAESSKRSRTVKRGTHTVKVGGPDAGKLRVLRHRLSGVSADRTAARSAASSISSTLSGERQQLSGWQHDYRFLPLDAGGVSNDIVGLNQDLGYLGSDPVIVKHYGGPVSPNPDITELLTQLGKLRLAVGIQTAQSGILGSFQKGTLAVPQTGLYQLHAGEAVTRAGVPAGGSDGGSIGDIRVHVLVEDGAVDPDKIKVAVMREAGELSRHIGLRSSERERSGRF